MVARAGGNWAVTGGQEAGGIPGSTEDTCWPDPKNGHSQQKAALGMQIPLAQYSPGGGQILPAWHDPRGTWIPLALCDLSSGLPSKVQNWIPVWKQLSSQWTGLNR